MVTKSSLLFVGLLTGVQCFAIAQADIEARNLLIAKLDKVQTSLAPNDSSKVSVTLRLADLLSERARQDAMDELEKGCQDCRAGDADRKKALRLYLEVVDRAPEASRGKVMIQIGHLYQMTGQDKNSIEFYNKVLGKEKAPQLQAEAHLALAELYYKKRDAALAKEHYQEVVENPVATSKGLAAYRIAWCDFNLGKNTEAVERMKKILSTPNLLNRSGVPGSPIDPQFHEEVAFDFVTFLAKEKFSEANMKALFDLSPEKIRIRNVQLLATEQERLGKKIEALTAWKFIFPYLSKVDDRMTAQLSMAQMYYDLGQKKEALQSFESALEVLKDTKQCASNQCEELRKRARQYVVNWHQQEKKSPTDDLAKAYALYTAAFPKDVDAHIYHSQVLELQKQDVLAWKALQPAIAILLENKEVDKTEAMLLKQLELAESSKDEAIHLQAMDLYLAKTTKKAKVFEVKYQKAKKNYDAANYAVAVEEFRGLAMDKSGSVSLRKQAADLSLDGLVLLKDETRLVAWAKDYATQFKDSAGEFNQIVQKSILTQSAALAGNNQEEAYKQLLAFDPSQAQGDDKNKFYKNKLILAERLKKFSEAQAAADELLAQKSISAEDREFAWARKAYLSELLLDFRTALAAIEKIEKGYKEEDKYLKMAIFAELSGASSEAYYQKYLSVSKDEANKQLVAAELVRKSKTPEKSLEAYRNVLEKNPTLYAQLATEIYAKSPSEAILKKMTKDSSLASTEQGKLLARVQFINKFHALKDKVTKLKLDTASDQKLARSIKTWAAGIDQLEEMGKQAIQSGDWTSQLISLHLLGNECERFYSDILSAPVPTGLNAEEEQQYLSLLTSQAAPYQSKAATAKMKVEEFWKNANWESSLKNAWGNRSLRSLTQIEVDAIKEIAPDRAASFANIQKEEVPALEQKPTMAKVQEARKKVYQSPLDKGALQELLSIEKKTENIAMVQYLESRISNLGKETQ